jgi:hypothetical protein
MSPEKENENSQQCEFCRGTPNSFNGRVINSYTHKKNPGRIQDLKKERKGEDGRVDDSFYDWHCLLHLRLISAIPQSTCYI